MRKKNLLIDEYPLIVLPSLAKAIGLNGAIALQQLHYWLENPKGGVTMDGERWVYNTYENWQADNFPFWSVRTVQRIFVYLEKIGFVISMQKAEYDRKKYYRVHYDKLASWNETECLNPEFQNGAMDDDKVASSLTETTETKSEITQRRALNEKEISQANAKVDAMISNAKKAKYQNRDKIPESYLIFADLYFELTKQEPTKRVIFDWFSTFEDWKAEGLLPPHIRAAWQHANRPDGGFPVGRPGALTNTAVAMKSKMIASTTAAPVIDHVAIENTKQMLQEKELVYVPMPDDVRAKLKKLSKQKEVSR